MLTARPESRFEDDNGVINLTSLLTKLEYPEVKEWDRQYAAECDRLAAGKAARYKRHWGRWYLDGRYLCTPVYRAPEGDFQGGCHEVYDFELSRCMSEAARRQWIGHMDEKLWMGEQGLKDLQRAFDELVKAGSLRK